MNINEKSQPKTVSEKCSSSFFDFISSVKILESLGFTLFLRNNLIFMSDWHHFPVKTVSDIFGKMHMKKLFFAKIKTYL